MNPQNLNPVLQAFFLKQERLNNTAPPPNPDIIKKNPPVLVQKPPPTLTLSDIIDSKPSRKQVLKYLKQRLNEIYLND